MKNSFILFNLKLYFDIIINNLINKLIVVYKYYILLIIKLENYGFKNFNSMNFYAISEWIYLINYKLNILINKKIISIVTTVK